MEIEQFFRSKVVIINGAAGFIGSHLPERLVECGAKVIGIDNFITGNRRNVEFLMNNPNFRLIEQDLNDQAGTLSVLEQIKKQEGRVDVVLHFASPASPPGYQKHPTETYLVNTLALHNVLVWLREYAPEARLLFAGSSEAYGNPQVHPQVETYWGNVNPNGPRACYDESKRMGESICGVFYRDFGLKTYIIRIFNTYGPRMDLEDGRVLPQFIKQVQAGEKLTVYGDGLQTRSYCYVDDLVAGALAFVASDYAGETINLGNPGEFTILQTAQIVNQVTGRAADQLEYRPLPIDDPLKRQPDISKAKKLLGWQPQVPFRQGLARMLAFYQVQTNN